MGRQDGSGEESRKEEGGNERRRENEARSTRAINRRET